MGMLGCEVASAINTGQKRLRVRARPSMKLKTAYRDLFDRHGKSPDQLGNLIQMAGIMLFDGTRQTGHAFIVAQRDDVVRNDRGHLVTAIGSKAASHRINLREIRQGQCFRAK
jgi:hypothetical protein